MTVIERYKLQRGLNNRFDKGSSSNSNSIIDNYIILKSLDRDRILIKREDVNTFIDNIKEEASEAILKAVKIKSNQ